MGDTTANICSDTGGYVSVEIKRVCLMGAESTGKTTLAQQLARHFQTIYVPEFARVWLDISQEACQLRHASIFVKGQMRWQTSMESYAHRLIFCDTDPLTTQIWCEFLYQQCPTDVKAAAQQQSYDMYLLLNNDIPWEADHMRCLNTTALRDAFFLQCEQMLQTLGRPYQIIGGEGEQRLQQAIDVIKSLL